MRIIDTPGTVVLLLAFVAGSSLAQDQPLTLRYKFKPGDHLIYRETFERDGKSPQQTFRTRTVFTNHIVVVDQVSGLTLVGIQRNRQSSELLEYRENGNDRLADQKAAFDQHTAKRPARFFDANVYTSAGLPQLPLEVLREATSDLLYGVSEIAALPAAAVQVGSEWPSATNSRMRMRVIERESGPGEACVKVKDAAGIPPDMHLAFTFCPDSGDIAFLSFEGQYRQIGDATIREHVTFELVEARHGENSAAWLSDKDVRMGALDAYLVSTGNQPDAAALENLLRDHDPEVQALALAVYNERSLAVPPETLALLKASQDAQVRRIAARLAAKPTAASTALCQLPAVKHSRQKPGTTLRGMGDGPFAGTAYIARVPIDYKGDQPFPLIIYLSGGGGRALDGAHTADEPLRDSGFLVIYPQANGLWWEPQPTQMVDALLQQVLRDFNVDTHRVYLAGFSNGGTGALTYATLWPDRFAAVASLMGAGVQTPAHEKLALENLTNLPVLFLHGDKDERIPSSASTATYEQLRALHPGVAPELHILENRQHDVTLDSDEGYTLPFFARFTRDANPHRVMAEFSDEGGRRQYWVEVMEKGSGTAQVTAQLRPNNVIELKTKNVNKLRLLLHPEMFPGAGPVGVRVNGKELPPHEVVRDCAVFTKSAEQYEDAGLAYTDEIVVSVSK